MKTGYKPSVKKKSMSTIVKAYSMPEMKPTFSLTEKELSAIKDWKVGETYQIVLTVKEVSVTQDSRDSYPEKRAVFEIQKAEVEEKDK